MKDIIDFTDRERFVLSYYRDPGLARWQRYAMLEGTLVAVSLCLLLVAYFQHDRAWALVAYALLLWRTCASVWRARLFIDSFRSILAKYDAKITELADRPI
jgi:hypothetical protein